MIYRPQKKTKILFLSHGADLCGSERSLYGILKGLNKRKYKPLLLIPCNGPLKGQVEDLGIKVIVYPLKRWIPFYEEYRKDYYLRLLAKLPLRIRFLCKLIQEEDIDLVYSNSLTIVEGAIAAKLKGIPHIYHIRNIMYKNSLLKTTFPVPFISLVLSKFSDKIIMVSKAVERNFHFKGNGRKNEKIEVIHNGIDIKKYSANNRLGKRNLRVRLKLSKDTKIVALVGSFTEHKGQEDFIEAARIVTRRFAKVAFILIGSGENGFLRRLKGRARELMLESKVYFFSFRKDIIPIYQNIDILVSASHNEPFARNIYEAMSMGRPVVATRSAYTGSDEIVTNGKEGILVPVHSPKKLAKAVMQLLDNPNLARRMGKEGKLRVAHSFNLPRYIADIENAIEEVLNKVAR